MTCHDAIEEIKKSSYDQFPVKCSSTDKLLGMVTSTLLMSKLANQKVKSTDPIIKVMTKEFRNMSSDMPVSELARVLERQNFVFVDGTHIVSSYDLLDFMQNRVNPTA
jgi:predicted transcriptional regulator